MQRVAGGLVGIGASQQEFAHLDQLRPAHQRDCVPPGLALRLPLLGLAARLVDQLVDIDRCARRQRGCLCPLKLSHYRCASGRVWHGSEAVFGRGVFEDIAAG
jgi:hypothetical protein